jgi:hypothetical protein
MTAPARFRLFRITALFRPAVRLVLVALGLWRLTPPAAGAYPLLSQTVPFTICRESTTWTRPTASQQAKIWSDARYSDHGANAYEWNHQFLLVPPESASIQYHAGNEAGLWTEDTLGPGTCDEAKYKHDDEWVGAWILLHRVKNIQADGSVYTISVEPTAKGFQSIIFRRIAPTMSFRFVDVTGRMLDEVRN